ncbi:AAA family ATPase [Xanthomonas campestris]|uniref:AAA family ATPase n=1 Tax=Xanthomonas campestris TaxID=339 RepID=UPI000E1F9F41|nr:AAA family ATPase [Xanthomonas campestris]
MLKQLVHVKGVGLLHDAGKSPDFGRVVMIFGENGRGKSTLATILRSCGEGEVAALAARRTLGGTLAQSIQITIADDAGKDETVLLTSLGWSKPIPDLQVFDTEFVSRNVYAGATISTDQRAKLLEFALGKQAVALRKKVDEAAAKLTEATGKISAQTMVLQAHAGTTAANLFVRLPPAPEADKEITALEKRIGAANARDELLKKKTPAPITLPALDSASLFEILAKSLPDVESSAEHAVRVHLSKCNDPSFEEWVSRGGSYVIGEDCPYCGSSIRQNELIKAYRTHFNKAYGDLKSEVARLEAQVKQCLGDVVAESLERTFETAQAHLDSWKGLVEAPPIDFDVHAMKALLAELRTLVQPLVRAKSAQPLESFGSANDLERAKVLWTSAVKHVTDANARISAAVASVDSYRKSLSAEDVNALRAAIQDLKLRKLRHTQAVQNEVDILKELLANKKARADEKDRARELLDQLMTSTLDKYQIEINTLLSGFGTQVRIEQMRFDYRGGPGLPRSEFQLQVRGSEVRLAGDLGAAFGNALSEGDKRSLAFAFFIARLHQDPQLSNRIVVIDDPMCSLDRRRRAATIRILKALAPRCRQLIVLAHDPYFLQALDDELRRTSIVKPAGALTYCKIMPAANDYSTFGDLALADECATQYEHDVTAIMAYLAAPSGMDRANVAKCLRVVLETSLHQQFPSFIPRGMMLGSIISVIEKAVAPNPLAALSSSVQELRALNDYAKGFHHADDGTPPDVTSIDEGELLGYCNRVLAFVLRG